MMQLLQILFIVLIAFSASAGDFATGPIAYQVDLGQEYTAYQVTTKDRAWGTRLAKKFKYQGEIVYFTRTSIQLSVDGEKVEGQVYQGIEQPSYFYVIQSDTMLQVGASRAVSPGSGGFFMSAPQSKNFIVCFNCMTGGVPYLFSTQVSEATTSWRGDNNQRL